MLAPFACRWQNQWPCFHLRGVVMKVLTLSLPSPTCWALITCEYQWQCCHFALRFFDGWYYKHGLPDKIFCNWDKLFLSKAGEPYNAIIVLGNPKIGKWLKFIHFIWDLHVLVDFSWVCWMYLNVDLYPKLEYIFLRLIAIDWGLKPLILLEKTKLQCIHDTLVQQNIWM